MSVFSLFGKKRLKEEYVAKVFVSTINGLAMESFPILKDYLNDVPELKCSPEIEDNQLEWFLYIVFSANLYHLKDHFDTDQHNRMRILVIDEFIESLEDQSHDKVLSHINLYEDYVAGLDRSQSDDLGRIMALAIFQKYGLNKCQDDHFQNINQPNPTIIKAISEITDSFIWNWDDLLGNFKLVA
jgi:hypothetical protein